MPDVLDSVHVALNLAAAAAIAGFCWSAGCWLFARLVTPFGRRDPG